MLRLSPKEYYDKWWLSFRAQLIIAFFTALYLFVIYVNFVIGFVSALRKRTLNLGVHLYLGGVLFYLLVASAGPEAYARFRAPLMPLFIVYASFGVLVSLSRIRNI
jgi:hypothetical protein